MFLLALDSSFRNSLSLFKINNKNPKYSFSCFEHFNDKSWEFNIYTIKNLLNKVDAKEITKLIVGTGPGRQAALKSSIAFMKGIQFATGINLRGISSIDAFAYLIHRDNTVASFKESTNRKKITVSIPSIQKYYLYYASYLSKKNIFYRDKFVKMHYSYIPTDSVIFCLDKELYTFIPKKYKLKLYFYNEISISYCLAKLMLDFKKANTLFPFLAQSLPFPILL